MYFLFKKQENNLSGTKRLMLYRAEAAKMSSESIGIGASSEAAL